MTIEEEFESLRGQHPLYRSPGWTVSPPYLNERTLRRHVFIENYPNHKTTRIYAKFIMECKLGRLLTDEETVHHKNTVEFDDRIDNLEIRDKHKHLSEHKIKPPEIFTCKGCGTIFSAKGVQLSKIKTRMKEPNYNGPYCTWECYINNR